MKPTNEIPNPLVDRIRDLIEWEESGDADPAHLSVIIKDIRELCEGKRDDFKLLMQVVLLKEGIGCMISQFPIDDPKVKEHSMRVLALAVESAVLAGVSKLAELGFSCGHERHIMLMMASIFETHAMSMPDPHEGPKPGSEDAKAEQKGEEDEKPTLH